MPPSFGDSAVSPGTTFADALGLFLLEKEEKLLSEDFEKILSNMKIYKIYKSNVQLWFPTRNYNPLFLALSKLCNK